MLVTVVLCGGQGSRLWPLSRTHYPKPLIPLFDKKSLLQLTLERNVGLTPEAPLIICGEAHRFVVADQLQALNYAAKILLEPVPKDTAPAVAMAAHYFLKSGLDPVMLVCPSDHLIQPLDAYHQSIQAAYEVALNNNVVTMGVRPTEPSEAFGYIEAGQSISNSNKAFLVERFVEKPNLTEAARYIVKGNYYWNSGIYLCRASFYLAELNRYAPNIVASTKQALESLQTDNAFMRMDESAFTHCPKDSIDYALAEKTKAMAMVPLEASWSDLGSWKSFYDLGEKKASNVIEGNVLTQDVTRSYIRAEHRVVAAVDVDDLVIVETRDAVLVAKKTASQAIKKLVGTLEVSKPAQVDLPSCVHRPWGTYEVLETGEGFQVKRIVVKPGAKLSLQLHHKRSEHWVVVQGTAKVTCGEKNLLLNENQSIYIPIKTKHRLENVSNKPLKLIEVQCGHYLGEDDIVRFEDNYGRKAPTEKCLTEKQGE